MFGIVGQYPIHQRCESLTWYQAVPGSDRLTIPPKGSSSALIVQLRVGCDFARQPGVTPLRVALSGFLYHGERTYADTSADMSVALQNMQQTIDQEGPLAFRRLCGNFIVCYVAPDLQGCYLFRSITSTQTLYYRRVHDALMWATNPADLLERSPRLDDVDTELLPAIATAGDIDPNRSCYTEIKRLPTGHCLVVHSGSMRMVCMDDFAIPSTCGRQKKLIRVASEFRDRVSVAAARRFSGLDKVGIFLSGGLDSAVVAHELQKLKTEVVGLHWSWSGIRELREELECARLVSRSLGIRLVEFDFTTSVKRGGNYVTSMADTCLPYNHGFYHCFAVSGSAAGPLGLQAVSSGHLGDALFTVSDHDFQQAYSLPPWKRLSRKLSRIGWGDARQRGAEGLQAPRVEAAQSWLTPSAAQRAVELGSYRYRAADEMPSAHVYEAIKRMLHQDSELDTVITNDILGQAGSALAHVFTDRDIVEFALGLANEQRCRYYGGILYSKIPMRAAYLGDLPPLILSRESRAPYVAVAETFVRNNLECLWKLLGQGSRLAELGVIAPAALRSTLESRAAVLMSAQALVRCAGTELWLRRHDGAQMEIGDQPGWEGMWR